jgi:hypothetical protein
MNLNKIIEEFHELEDQIIEAGGEITPEVEAAMSWNTDKLNDKLDGYAGFISYLKGQADYLKSEQAKYRDRQRATENMITHMRESVLYAMRIVGEIKIKTLAHSYSVRQTESWKLRDITPEIESELIADGLAEKTFKASLSEIKKKYADNPPEYIEIINNESVTIR